MSNRYQRSGLQNGDSLAKVCMGVHSGKHKGECHGEDTMVWKGCQKRDAKRGNPQG